MTFFRALVLVVVVFTAHSEVFAAAQQRNVILFVPDGLRAGIVTPETAPALAELRAQGVDYTNSHSMVPTFTMPNASAFATGHYLGDTGVVGNTMLMEEPVGVPPALPTVTPFIENDATLRELDTSHFYRGNFINAETLLAMARKSGFAVAALGKHGPVGLQDISLLGYQGLLYDDAYVFDDTSGNKGGLTIADDVKDEIATYAGQPPAVPPRGRNADSGSCDRPGTLTANEVQQRWFTDVATKVLLPRFKNSGKPFFMVFWARDPDGTQHNHGDSFGEVVPGINGPTSMKAIANTDDSLRQLRRALKKLGLENTTDIIVSADHGFSTASKESKTSAFAVVRCGDRGRMLPQGFVAMDLAKALELPLADPDAGYTAITTSSSGLSKRGHGVLGSNPKKPDVVVIANGGSDLIYLPGGNRNALLARIVNFLMTQDYVSGLFVDDSYGKVAGTLPMSAVGLKGNARGIPPALLVNFRSYATDCGLSPLLCAATVVDAGMAQGQGQHGSLSRADTSNFMAAIGPSFKQGFKDPAPTSNADVGATIAHLLGLKLDRRGKLIGRVMTESLVGGRDVAFKKGSTVSAPGLNGLTTILNYQSVGATTYYDAAGFPGRTVGLEMNRSP